LILIVSSGGTCLRAEDGERLDFGGCGGGGASAVYLPNYGIIAIASGGGGGANRVPGSNISFREFGGGGGAGPRGGNGGGLNAPGLNGYPGGYLTKCSGVGGDGIQNDTSPSALWSAAGGGGGIFGGGAGGIGSGTYSGTSTKLTVMGGGSYINNGANSFSGGISQMDTNNMLLSNGAGGGGIYANNNVYNLPIFIGQGGLSLTAHPNGYGDANTFGLSNSASPSGVSGIFPGGLGYLPKNNSFIASIVTYVRTRPDNTDSDTPDSLSRTWNELTNTPTFDYHGHGGNNNTAYAKDNRAGNGGNGCIKITPYYNTF